MLYEPNPNYVDATPEESSDKLKAAIRGSIERNPQGVDTIVQEMKAMGKSVTREEALADLGFDEDSIRRLLARI